MACFGEKITLNTVERNHRFLEESLELVQSCGCTQSEAHQLVDYVFHRNIGEKNQETGGVMVTLAALCNAQDIRMIRAGRDELARVWTKIEKIRAKHAAKPAHSPLPAPEPVEYEQISSREWVPKSPAPEPDSAFGTMVDKARIPQPAPQQDDAAVRKESK
jgi:hypothetical protein